MEEILELTLKKRSVEYAYKMGIDCAKNGVDLKNCDFSIFSSKENTKAWERGFSSIAFKPKKGES